MITCLLPTVALKIFLIDFRGSFNQENYLRKHSDDAGCGTIIANIRCIKYNIWKQRAPKARFTPITSLQCAVGNFIEKKDKKLIKTSERFYRIRSDEVENSSVVCCRSNVRKSVFSNCELLLLLLSLLLE